MIKVGIFGASGYTGFETVNILRKHPQVKIEFATSESSAGKMLSQLYPISWDVPLISRAEAALDQVEAVFCCLPHGASMSTVAAARNAGVRVIDLSADFRLEDKNLYEHWYGLPHEAPELLSEAVYGLPELYRTAIEKTNILANPGCYPTSILLALYPLLQAQWLDLESPIIADSKSGVSGAGRKPSLVSHFVEINENLYPYKIGQTHRHVAEMAATINNLGGKGQQLIFSPHLVPVNRGILSTIYVSLNDEYLPQSVYELYADSYRGEPFIQLLPLGQLASMAHTRYTNLCTLSLSALNPRQLILCASIDNLGKGAAGQAVQNFNLMFGLEETTGLSV